MKPIRDNIIRPLLCVRRIEIENILKEYKQGYCIDSTNQDIEYTRNKIRNVLIPYMQDNINTNSVENICNMASTVSEAELYIKKQAGLAFKQCVSLAQSADTIKAHTNIADVNTNNGNLYSYVIDVDKFKAYDNIIQKYIIRDILGKLAGKLKDIYKIHVEQIVGLKDKSVGVRVDVAYKITARRSYNAIIVEKKNYNELDNATQQNGYIQIQIDLNHSIIISNTDIYHNINNKINIFNNIHNNSDANKNSNYDNNAKEVKKIAGMEFKYYQDMYRLEQMEKAVVNNKKIIENTYTKVFDYDKIKFALQLRTRRAGDIIQVNSDGGTKKLKDYFIDQKIDKGERDNILLLADGNHIVWIVGYRISEEYKVTDSTTRVLYSTVKFGKE